jgi:hypothetical protein
MRLSELVILVLILVVVLGLVTIGVQTVNERALRNECQNNLKQVGLAIHHYRDMYGRFPAATMSNPDLPPERRLSWLLAIIPFVESTRIFKDADKEKGWDAEENRPIAVIDFGVYLCRANPERHAESGEGLTHYVGIAGVGRKAATLPLGDPRAGFFGYRRGRSIKGKNDPPWERFQGIRLEDIEDGVENTVMVVETNSENGPWLAGGWPTVRGLDPGGPAYLGKGGQFGSFHRHGSNAVFANGSVRFLADSRDSKVFEALATIAGKEEVRPFD